MECSKTKKSDNTGMRRKFTRWLWYVDVNANRNEGMQRRMYKRQNTGMMVYGGRIKLDSVPSKGQKSTLRNLGVKFLNAVDHRVGSACVHEITPVHLNWEQCSQCHAGCGQTC